MRALLAAGLGLRLAVVALSDGFGYDQQGFYAAERAFTQLGLSAYEGTNNLWPYPPAYFPWLAVAQDIGWFTRTLRLPAVLADVVIAWLVADLLARRGAQTRTRIAAAAVVLFGPVFVANSAHHGQLDSVAIAFGLAAVWVWTRPGQKRRALLAGLLIGLGGTVKTVPLLLVLALSPSAGSWRERAQLALSAGGIWLAAVLPFYFSAPDAVRDALTYKGVPGFGGLSLIALKLEQNGLFPTDVLSFRAGRVADRLRLRLQLRRALPDLGRPIPARPRPRADRGGGRVRHGRAVDDGLLAQRARVAGHARLHRSADRAVGGLRLRAHPCSAACSCAVGNCHVAWRRRS
jgi:hypothetical protein